MTKPLDVKPEIVILSFEESLLGIFVEVLTLEGYPTSVVHTAAQALDACRRSGRCVVMMDNYHVSKEALNFARMLFAERGLHARAKVLGAAAMRHENLVDLDGYLALPFTIDQLLIELDRLTTEPTTSQ